MQGAQEATFQAEADLASTTVRQAWSRPPIQVDFSGELHIGTITTNQLAERLMRPSKLVVMFTASGLLVRFLKVFEKNNYQSVKWVRYMTKASGTYQIRVSSFRSLRWLSLH